MAVERGLTVAVGDALVALVDWAWPRVSRRVDGLLEQVAEAVRPDPPLSIRSLDGELLTGVIVVDRGKAGAGQPPIPLGPSHPERGRSRFEDEAIPPWARDLDIDPYRRR